MKLTRLAPVFSIPLLTLAFGCANTTTDDEVGDPKDECVFCGDEKADAFGIARESYLAYGIVELANTASFTTLDDDVALDRRAATGIVDQRPFDYIEQIDTVSYVGRSAFAKLAIYAEDNGYVPFCGDGELQAILESCDDGNDVDGDGCSASCVVEDTGGGADTNALLAQEPDLIKGSDIGTNLVNANSYYFRERSIKEGCCVSDRTEMEELLHRADGIIANEEANDKVSFDELAVLSTEPFYSSLFADEKDALKDAWTWFEISSKPVAVIDFTGAPFDVQANFATVVERPGPFEVISRKLISDLEYTGYEEVARRLQQLPGANKDGNNNTVHYEDIVVGLEDFQPVFTQDEVDELEALQRSYFDEANLEPSTPGEYRVEYSDIPTGDTVSGDITAFDDYTFKYTTRLELHYEAKDKNGSYDVNVYSKFRFHTLLLYKGRSNQSCGYTYGPDPFCMRAFSHREIKFKHFNDSERSFRDTPGLAIMEHYDDGERIYNRVVRIEDKFSNYDKTSRFNDIAAARPTTLGVQNHSFRKSTTSNSYQKFKISNVQTAFNRNLEKFLPNISQRLDEIAPGRYNEFEGVVLDVHESGAMFAYVGSCELAFEIHDSGFRASGCGKSIRIYPRSSSGQIHVGNKSSYLYGGYYDDPRMTLDTSYYVLK